jgi:hypothetical protein
VGNPYPSFLSATNSPILNNNLLAQNSLNLKAEFVALYFWDGTQYLPKNLTDNTIAVTIAPGQAFLINAAADNATFTFSEDLQTVQPSGAITLFKTATPEITLHLTSNAVTKTTKLKYYSNTTKGLDRGYDAGTFEDGTPAFSLDTHLVEDSNGINFTLQCLPNTDFENSVVPLAVRVSANETITFSTTLANLPEGINVFLEDTQTKTIKDITTASYQVTPKNALAGIGRFYLHTANSVLSTDDLAFGAISMYKTSNTNLRITGVQQIGNATVNMYNVLGKQLFTTSFNMETVNDIALPKNLAIGVYIIQLASNRGTQTKKIIIE